MSAPDHGIVLWTLIVAAISTVIALAATVIAYMTARYAKDAIRPLEGTVTRLDKVARLQDDSIRAAERISKLEKLLREIEICGKVLDGLLSVSLIEERAATAAGGDLDEMSRRQDAMFLVARSQLLGAIHQLPSGWLPEATKVANLPGFSGSDPYVEAARQEVVLILGQLQGALDAPPDENLNSSRARSPDAQTDLSYGPETNHGRPASWVAVSIIIIGFIVGGIAMVVGQVWWLFWSGGGIVVIGGIFALSEGVLDDWY
jgi:hypothetical protein